jgi:hypothetical protein
MNVVSSCRILTLSQYAALVYAILFASGLNAEEAAGAKPKLATVQQMIDARTDVWGDAAMRQPNGANYEFFKNLLPPIRWTNTDFRHYPIVLSAPRAAEKARLISNGSAVNARANKPPMWYEQGTPVEFFVGDNAEPFGQELTRLETPTYQDGFLPIVSIKYRSHDKRITYAEEAFAPVGDGAAATGAAMIRFTSEGGDGRIEARLPAKEKFTAHGQQILNRQGKCVVSFTKEWTWTPNRNSLTAKTSPNRHADLVIFTKAADAASPLVAAKFDQQRDHCARTWLKLLSDKLNLTTPEPLVNDAWRSLVIGTMMIAEGDRLNYSAGNAYGKLYEGECGDTLQSVMLFGHLKDAAPMLKPLLEFNREDTKFHVAGHKLQLLAWFYWMTRDADTVRAYRPLWQPSLDLILNSREQETGLLPKDRYAGDIATKVYSLNSNANCWRALRDLAAVLDKLGEDGEARKLRTVAADFRKSILAAVEKSERRDAKPPFIPVALLADEEPHDPLTATRTGSYYDLICPYIIGSGIFGHGSQREDWLLGYLQQHGGVAMGMMRTKPASGQFENEPGVVPLYGVRYQLALLRRDEREKALVGFYGHLAQGMTRGTFIGGEGERFVHGDKDGRSFYLPPNSASNAAWLIVLRNLLVQDWDLDEDGKPETLRLLYGAPRRWLEDGKRIDLVKAPTAFGEVALHASSNLKAGSVEIKVELPSRPVKKVFLRAPLPDGWKVDAAEVDGQQANLIGADAVELPSENKVSTVKFRVEKTR